MNNYSIRVEEERDYLAVESLVRESFWNVYRPDCTEHYVLHHLRNGPDFIPELAFVMEVDGKIIGQNVFLKAQITKNDGFTQMKMKSVKRLSQGRRTKCPLTSALNIR